jgi:hypothetical protein
MSAPPDESRIVAEIPKGRHEVIRVTRESYHGHRFVQLRVWFKAEGGEFRPSKSGIAIAPDKLDATIAALQVARP